MSKISKSTTKKRLLKIYIDNDKLILRFLAKLNTKELEDVDKRFLISFFFADDSIQVYEMKNRNSGKILGKKSI